MEGGRRIAVTPDSKSWQDIPLYVRDGSILAMLPAQQGNDLSPAAPLVLDVFPSSTRTASFLVYDNDGLTYDYEKGGYFRQEMTATRSAGTTGIEFGAVSGSFRPHFPSYLLRVHQAGTDITSEGRRLKKFPSASAFEASSETGWFSTTDRFGAVTEVRLNADANRHSLTLR